MITIDDREGSRDLKPLLDALKAPCELGRLEYGDCAWEGRGRRGRVMVGVERKRLGDALNCMTGGRFAGHQLPGLLETYSCAVLIVEGIWRANPRDGVLETAVPGGWRAAGHGRRPHMARDLDNWLTSLAVQTRLIVRTTDTPWGTARAVCNMHGWWQKDWEDHGTLHVLYTPPPPHVLVMKPGLVRRMAAQLKGIGWERSRAVENKFRTALDMALALEADWRDIPGIGGGTAASVIRQWQGEEDEGD